MQQKFSVEEYRNSFLSEERLAALYEDKLFKLFVPEKYGGLERNLESGAEELIRIASIQGGLGWALNLGAGANWFSGFFLDQAAQEIVTPKDSVIAGSGFASGEFLQQDDHFFISGTWSRCSGAHHATFFSLKAKNENGDVKTFVVPREQVTISKDDWPIAGLRNASSYTISMQEAKIPSRYAFEINTIQNSRAYAIHKIPFEPFARVCMSASFIGIVKCLIHRSYDRPLNKPSLEFISNHLEPMVNSAETSCLNWANKLDNHTQVGQLTTERTEQLRKELAEKNVQLFHEVQQLFLKGGLPFVEEDTVVHWAYRDVLTAIQHQMVKG